MNFKFMTLTISLVILLAPMAHAETWVCYDPSATPSNDVTLSQRADCTSIGICTGPGHAGLDSNCFEATVSEFIKAKGALVKVDTGASAPDRVIDWTATEISDKAATDAQAVIDAETTRVDAIDTNLNSSQSIRLTNVENRIDNIGNLNEAKVFLKKLVRYIARSSSSI